LDFISPVLNFLGRQSNFPDFIFFVLISPRFILLYEPCLKNKTESGEEDQRARVQVPHGGERARQAVHYAQAAARSQRRRHRGRPQRDKAGHLKSQVGLIIFFVFCFLKILEFVLSIILIIKTQIRTAGDIQIEPVQSGRQAESEYD
jgi:hypothetical protein